MNQYIGRDSGATAPLCASSQRDLFGNKPAPAYPDTPGWKESTTSRDAALTVAADSSNLRTRVYELLQSLDPDESLTADQIAAKLQRSPLSVRPRVSELAAANKIVRAPNRAKNISGMTAHTWRIAR